ncbi:putative bifunctional diguanylate cyclase/phosphodiesterase [Aestuariibacter salexigens]|uniref:putative bifunctional diguanylate cyclase/phosphodiesterase n=1 Tax=Aestuariibacter salexigens TaxID=226010 RepID=UPI0003FE1153|nr:GGDEF domain-containing protein [Aestuariibacter salexigens]
MTAFYTALIALNLFCAGAFFLTGKKYKQNHFLALGVLNVLVFLFNALSLRLLSESNLHVAVEYSKLHTAVLLISYPVICYAFGLWAKFKYTIQVSTLFAALSVPVVVVNFMMDGTIRYGAQPELVSYTTMFGDVAYLLKGSPNAYYIFLHLAYLVNTFVLAYFSWRLLRRHRSLIAYTLLFTILLQLGSSYTGYALDRMQDFWVYTGGIPWTFLSVVIAVSVAAGFADNARRLQEEQDQRNAMQDLFAALAKISVSGSRANFYVEAGRLLAKFSRADYVIIGFPKADDAMQIQTRAFIKHQSVKDNFSYHRRGTPCENVLSDDTCVYEDHVADLFPEDAMLADEGIEAYIGYPIVDATGQTIGLIALLFCHPIKKQQSTVQTALDVFASRLSAELRQEQSNEKLRQMAYVDYLTGLPNRAKLIEKLQSFTHKSKQVGMDSVLLVCGIDRFAEVNNKFGYDVGDRILKVLAERLKNYASNDMFVSRTSRDEFAIALPPTEGKPGAIIDLQWAAISALIEKTCVIGDRKINLSCSMGAVVFPSYELGSFDLLSAAEYAMHLAKDDGRRRYRVYEHKLVESIERKRHIELLLNEALQKNSGLSVAYQPKTTHDGKLVGAEALIRWHHDDDGFISPAEFIPVAEESGLIFRLGLWVMESVFRQMRDWQSKGHALVPVSINVTASQINDPDFATGLLKLLAEYAIPAYLVELELTESGLLANVDNAVEVLSSLRKEGIKIALDDFGTGYSSLSYLSELPLDVLKIDKSFVDKVGEHRSQELIRSIIAIGKTLGLKSVAEGTEHRHQVDTLASQGCEVFQGYYFSKPIAAAEFQRWLSDGQD